jgi:hypothetical protein
MRLAAARVAEAPTDELAGKGVKSPLELPIELAEIQREAGLIERGGGKKCSFPWVLEPGYQTICRRPPAQNKACAGARTLKTSTIVLPGGIAT